MSYTPPAASAALCRGVDFTKGVPIAPDFLALVQAADHGRARKDPSTIAALLRLPGGVVFWDAKLAVDADGLHGSELDPESGQNETSFRFEDHSSLYSPEHPYLVLPLGAFRGVTELQLGDLAVVLYRGQITGAMFGDLGPSDKLGEGSIAVHDDLRPAAPDCCHRDSHGQPTRIIDSSIEHSVLVFAFPHSAIVGLTPGSLATQVRYRALQLFHQFTQQLPPQT